RNKDLVGRAQRIGRDNRNDPRVELRPEIPQIAGVEDAVVDDKGGRRQRRLWVWDALRKAVARQRRDERAVADARDLIGRRRNAFADPLIQIDDQRALYRCGIERVAELSANARRAAVTSAVLEARQQVVADVRRAAEIEVVA